MASLIQIRRGTKQEWSDENPILNSGEFGFETDTGRLKIGDSTKPWINLEYFVRNENDIRGDLLPLTLQTEDVTIRRSDGVSIIREESGTAILENISIGVNVSGIAAGSGGGGANTAFYRLSLGAGGTELNWETVEGAEQVDLGQEDQYHIGTGSFSLINNNLVLVI
jgi:hypothetical protein